MDSSKEPELSIITNKNIEILIVEIIKSKNSFTDHITMKIVTLYGLIICIVNAQQNSNFDKFYQQHGIEHNPGLYFEKVDQVRIVNKRWRLMFTIDLEN